MATFPDYETFAKGYAAGRAQLVYARLISDLETPVSAFLKLADGKDNAFLFESVEGGETRGRYSIIGLAPDLIWRCRNGKAEINRRAAAEPSRFVADSTADHPLSALRALLRECQLTLPDGVPSMAAGLFGYLGYDVVRMVERLGDPPPDPLDLPDAVLIRPTITAIFDNLRDEILLSTPVWHDPQIEARAAHARACERLNDAVTAMERTHLALPAAPADVGADSEIRSNVSREEYLAIVERAKEYIRAGDIFQVVPSQRFSRRFELPAFALYRSLRRINPSPYLYFLSFPGFSIVGSSPEILVRLKNNRVTIRPIAGTRPRGANNLEDERLASDLASDPKERAEHLMLLDLGRNDVGRVAVTGEVHVTDSFFIERYSHVMHLVSNVEGVLRPGLDAVDALAAGLPAGTLTGAPKIRAMQIIDEFEKVKRGAVYAGAVGYFGTDGSMDTCIVLRTALVKDRVMYVQAGGGVVADSVPEAEYQETVNKAKALMTAAEDAVAFASAARRGQ
ncbi:MAG: anthranilate synthase component I [Alphaproteobacteria bacterium]|nr:anthranilate synthase component I [Alphaproteobacteria bacterium]